MARSAEASPFLFRNGSWLKNSEAFRLSDSTETWAYFEDIPVFEERDEDLIITLNVEIRPEQIAKDIYGTYELWWVIAVANNIRLPLSEFYPGRTIRCPAPGRILEQIRQDGVVRG